MPRSTSAAAPATSPSSCGAPWGRPAAWSGSTSRRRCWRWRGARAAPSSGCRGTPWRSRTPTAPIRPFSQLWTDRGVPVLGRIVAHDPDAYRYLPESVHRFPPAPELAEIMREAGLVDVGYRRLMMGVVALHVGTVPG